MQEKIHKILLINVPLSICNFRCHYCYLSQRDESYQGVQPEMLYSPEQVGYALRQERLGGLAFCNICADGETLLLKNLDKYVKAIVQEGHYVEIVSNMTITSMIQKILSLDKELLKHIEFKCSFHFLELKKRNLLQTFADNINLVWESGCSANIEITPTDELIPYIDEIKEFSMKNFKAYPHFTIARNDKTKGIDYLTNTTPKEYIDTWKQFESDFFDFKTSIFGVKQENFCYAGKWSAYINLATGNAKQCYCGFSLGNVFSNPDSPFPEMPVGKCNLAHCYNGHALLSLGLIPENNISYKYGDIRDREKMDGTRFLQPDIKSFFNGQLIETNKEYSLLKKELSITYTYARRLAKKIIHMFR